MRKIKWSNVKTTIGTNMILKMKNNNVGKTVWDGNNIQRTERVHEARRSGAEKPTEYNSASNEFITKQRSTFPPRTIVITDWRAYNMGRRGGAVVAATGNWQLRQRRLRNGRVKWAGWRDNSGFAFALNFQKTKILMDLR